MIDKDLDESRRQLASCDELISQCKEELDMLSTRLADLRRRQKEQFGALLMRTTLNAPIASLIKQEQDQHNAS